MTKGESRLTVGIVGAGEVVTGVHLPVLKAMTSQVVVEYVADVSSQAATRAGRAYRCQAVGLTDDIGRLPMTDLVLIATPVGVRMPYYELFAQRGTAVLAEKPAVRNLAELKAIQRIFPQERFSVGFQRRLYASSTLVSRVINQGTLGALQAVTVREGARTTSTGGSQAFMQNVGLSGGGILIDLGSHGIDLAFHLAGVSDLRQLSVTAFLDGHVDRQVELYTQIGPVNKSVDLTIDLSWLDFRPGTMEFTFERGSIISDSKPTPYVRLFDAAGKRMADLSVGNEISAGATTIHQACYLVWRSFLDGLSGASEPRLSVESVTPVVRTIESAYRALRGQS